MIYELQHHEFHKCLGLIHQGTQLEVKAIVAGINPGRIFVIDDTAPKSALVWQGNLDGFAFIGDPNDEAFIREIREYIDSSITPAAMELGLDWFECYGGNAQWNEKILEVLAGKEVGSWNQNVYVLNRMSDCNVTHRSLDQDFKVHQITSELLESSVFMNHSYLQEKVLEFWDTTAAFFEQGRGYCISHNNQVVSSCFSAFIYNGVHSVDIETLEKYRGKKLAQQAAHFFVKECLERQLSLYWDCMELNTASNAIAERLGFQKLFTYKCYEFKFGG